MPRVFNSTLENTLRIVLLLDAFGTPQNVDMIYAADFIVVYGRTFGISEEDLNGDNQYKFSEFVSRRTIVKKALKELVLDGFVMPSERNSEIVYQITDDGRKYCDSLESDYAREYRSIAKKVVQFVSGKTEHSIISQINKLSAKSLREANK